MGKRTMKTSFGWRIPEFPVNGQGGQVFIAQILRSLERVEQSFDSAWLSDHVIPWADWQSPATDNLEGWTTVNYLMGMFRRLSFGHIVLCNSFRNPALLAKMAATLSVLSSGRFILGIGAGWKKDEYLSYGYDFPEARVRIEALDEAVQIVRMMWTQDLVHFTGKHFKINGAYCNPKPSPIPPIMIGGAGEKLTLKVVASQADWWNAGLPLKEYEHKLTVLKKHCERIGRDHESIKKTWVGCIAIAETQDEALRIARNNRFAASETTIVGTPEQISQRLAEFADLGVEYFILRFLDFPSLNGIEQFAKRVAGRFR
jgi:alkanesulfonate monooxygenase SsuD/methylene tetrahydromethanopterin reductase-like flavin-dependent oxidoreductase (luciferase family)